MRSSGSVAEPVKQRSQPTIGARPLLDIDRIRQLIDMMVTNDLVELSLRDGDVEVNLRRPTGTVDVVPTIGGAHVTIPAASAPVAPTESPSDEDDGKLVSIKSPMVGTVYTSPDPDSSPFVQVGSRVNANTVVCIVEAMKVFNEIKAELSGTIEKIMIKNEEPIEYGQPLFLVRSD